jgi:hypothetical protein
MQTPAYNSGMENDKHLEHCYADCGNQHLEAWQESDGRCLWSVTNSGIRTEINTGESADIFAAMVAAAGVAGVVSGQISWRGKGSLCV